jgi:peptidase M23-like protein
VRGNGRAAAVAMLATGVLLGWLPAASGALASPRYDVPFPCGQTWFGSTRPDHSPSRLAIDFTRAETLGSLVVASAPGRVSTATDLGDTSYGKYVVVDHGDGFTTLDAHLEKIFVVVGQTLDRGDPIGLVGATGNATGPHLHYEQRLEYTDQHAWFDGARFTYNTAVTSANCPGVPITGSWVGGQASEVGMFRRATTSGRFRERLPDGQVSAIPYARSSDAPVTGDWNGDGHTDLGAWRASTHTFSLRMPDGTTRTIPFGTRFDRPVTGDWNGEGSTDVGVWSPATTTFFLRNPDGSVVRYRLGTPSDIPLTGDWNGSGKTGVGVYNPATQVFTLAEPSTGVLLRETFGQPGDLPVTGDWNGDGVTDIGVWTPSTATFSLRYSADRVERTHFGASR